MQKGRIKAFADASPRWQVMRPVEVVFHRGVAAPYVWFDLKGCVPWTKPASSAFYVSSSHL